ncbi:MAG: hypothetical protein ACRDFX_02640 [Chloroflexota bacterium]
MKPAGVLLESGDLIWVDAGEVALEPLDRVSISIDGHAATGRVMVTPGQMLSTPERMCGAIIEVLNQEELPEVGELPGAGMPPLGTRYSTREYAGRVIAIDPVKGAVTLDLEDGSGSQILQCDGSGNRFELQNR